MRQNNKVFILGNGPSLRGFDFNILSSFYTLGMNAAYRYWDQISWYPSFYACLDHIILKSHHKEIKRLIDRSEEYGIEGFFLRSEIFDFYPELTGNNKIEVLEHLQDNKIFLFDSVHVTTGSFSVRYAIYRGFSELIILGVDENYVKIDLETEKKEDITLEIKSTPTTNPNYFIDDYQQVGDLYQEANHNKKYFCNCRHCNGIYRTGATLHLDVWDHVINDIQDDEIQKKYAPIKIINCNPNSGVKVFPFGTLEDFLINDFDNAREVNEVDIKSSESFITSKVENDIYIYDPHFSFSINGLEKFIERRPQIGDYLLDNHSFTLSLFLRDNSPNKIQNLETWSSTLPMMPFLIGPFSCFCFFQKLQINLKCKHDKTIIFHTPLNNEWNHLELSFDHKTRQVRFFVNGKLNRLTKISSPFDYTRSKSIIGNGYLKRYWAGSIGDLYIFKNFFHHSNFDPNYPLYKYDDLIFSLHSFDHLNASFQKLHE